MPKKIDVIVQYRIRFHFLSKNAEAPSLETSSQGQKILEVKRKIWTASARTRLRPLGALSIDTYASAISKIKNARKLSAIKYKDFDTIRKPIISTFEWAKDLYKL